jgi:hypothetical protein
MTKQLEKEVERHVSAAERSLRDAKTYRDSHYARECELRNIEHSLAAIKRLVSEHICTVTLRGEE